MRYLAGRARLFGVIGAVVISSTALVGVATTPDVVSANQDVVPGEFPAANMPRVMNGRIYSIVTFGNNVIVGGTFTQIRAAAGGANIDRPYLFKFNSATGQIDNSFQPALNGNVEGVRYSPDGQWLFVGGAFTQVDGFTRQRVVKLNASTGAVDEAFVADANNTVKDLDLAGGRVVIGGMFRFVNGVLRERLAMLDPATGAPLSSFNLPVLESRFEFAQYVQELETSDDGSFLVVGGNFQSVGGQSRHQVAVIDLTGAQAVVANWATDRYVNDCASVYNDTWIRGIDVSPDSKWFTIGTTGAHFGANSLCDTATRWELPPTSTGSGLEPTWTTHSGGDTHWAMHVTDAAVYTGGHQRWENNPHPSPGGDNDGPGALSRPGIAALDPLTGVPLSWNPTRDRGRGVEAFASTPQQLFIGSDTVIFNGQIRQRLAVLSTAAGAISNPAPDNVVLPVDLRYAIDDRLFSTRFDGTTFTAPSQVSGTGIDSVVWDEVRDGFVQKGRFVYYGPASAYFSRSLTGNSFGAPTNLSTSVGYVDADRDLTPYDQPYGVAETVAATYAGGRIYYTKSNDSRLFWRWYSIQSGIIHGQEYLASSVNFSATRALDAVGGWLYVARSDDTLYRAKLLPGGGVNMTTWTLVDSGAVIDWGSVDSMFSTQAEGSVPPIPDPEPIECTNPAQPWHAVYHANTTLNAPAAERCEAGINYNYGSGAPAGTLLGPDQFSIRWDRTLTVAEGASLRISAGSDDGIRVYVDGQLVVNDWFDRGFTSRVVETGPLSGGDHEIVVEFYENAGGARVLAEFSQIGDLQCADPDPWSASYYNNMTVSGVPVVQRCEPDVDNDYGTGAPPGTGLGNDFYSARWSRTYALAQPRILRITGGSDDGIRVSVDGQLVINDWVDRGFTQRTVDTALLPAGEHTIAVEFYENGGDARVLTTIEEVVPPDTTAPDTTISTPAAGALVNTNPVSVTGTATDNAGVESVDVGVQNTSSGQWLQSDGTFGPSFAALAATLASPGATSTNWSLAVTLPNGSFTAQAVATDTSDNPDATAATRSFAVDTTPPDTTPPDGTISFPAKNEVVTTATPTFLGAATDDRGVARVTVALRNLTTLQYLRPDGAWQAAFVQIQAVLSAPGMTSTDWSLQIPATLANGQYRYEVRAFDAANNLDPTRPINAFTIAV